MAAEGCRAHAGDGYGYRGDAGDGAVVLSIRRDSCHVGMSGEAFGASAELVVGEPRYLGCGACLAD